MPDAIEPDAPTTSNDLAKDLMASIIDTTSMHVMDTRIVDHFTVHEALQQFVERGIG